MIMDTVNLKTDVNTTTQPMIVTVLVKTEEVANLDTENCANKPKFNSA